MSFYFDEPDPNNWGWTQAELEDLKEAEDRVFDYEDPVRPDDEDEEPPPEDYDDEPLNPPQPETLPFDDTDYLRARLTQAIYEDDGNLAEKLLAKLVELEIRRDPYA